MTKTEKRLLELCELVDAYFQLEQPAVKKAVESQLKEQTKEITEEITAKKLKPKDSMELPLKPQPSTRRA